MSIKKIIATIDCDKCGATFEGNVPLDATGTPTVFEAVVESLDTFADDIGGYNDGQFFCPKCWPEEAEKAFIKDVRDGKMTEQQLIDWGEEEYIKYLPRPALPPA